MDLTGLDTALLSDNSKITELEIHISCGWTLPTLGLTHVLQALKRRPTLTKLGLFGFHLDLDDARELGVVLGNTPNLQTLVLTETTLGSAGLAELASALYHNTSIKVLDISGNRLSDMISVRLLRDIIRLNKTMTTLDLSRNEFGQTISAVDYIADGLGSNSTLLKINLSRCWLGDDGVSTLARNLGSRNTTLQKLRLEGNNITSTGASVLLEMMEQNSHHITDLDLRHNSIGTEGASLLARSLGNNALPNLTCLVLSDCGIGDDGFIALVSALEQNTSLLHLDFRSNNYRMVSMSGPFWPWRRVYQRSKCCNDLTLVGAQVLPRPCLCYWQDCARTQACFVSMSHIVHVLGSHQHLKPPLDALAAGRRKWNV
jgi:Ran GTPase-activating protein (RanGAP) involved in mRNA processing and transport